MSRYLFDDMWSVGEQIARARKILVCLEFDGVVAPEMEEDSLISVLPQMQRVLWSLANDSRHTLAFLSHRSRMELQMRIGLPDVWYAGCHGLEISGPDSMSIHPAAACYSEQLPPLAARLKEQLRTYSDLSCEDRGTAFRIPLYNQPASIAEQVQALAQELASHLAPLCRLESQEDFLEVRPAVSWNRASAVKLIQQRLREPALLVYLGKDDESTFLALDEAITIRVGEWEKSAAQYYLSGPADVRRFLEWVTGLNREAQGLFAATTDAV